MQLGLNGAAIRQHMRKIFKYCNIQIHQSKSQGPEKSRKSRQHQKKSLEIVYERFFSEVLRVQLKVKTTEHFSSFQVFRWKQPAANELSRVSQSTVVGYRSHLLRSRFFFSKQPLDTFSDCNMIPLKKAHPMYLAIATVRTSFTFRSENNRCQVVEFYLGKKVKAA